MNEVSLSSKSSLLIVRCETKDERAKASEFVNANHSYIRWADRPSRKMYWTLYEDSVLVGVFGLGSAFARPKAIASFMRENGIAFNEIANNIVYCLYGQSANAGTRFLRMLRTDAGEWWTQRYGDNLKAIQTFVLPPRTGAIYRADNWLRVGSTTGGSTLTVRTLYGDDIALHPEAERRVFRSGEVKVLLREFRPTDSKIMLVTTNIGAKGRKDKE